MSIHNKPGSQVFVVCKHGLEYDMYLKKHDVTTLEQKRGYRMVIPNYNGVCNPMRGRDNTTVSKLVIISTWYEQSQRRIIDDMRSQCRDREIPIEEYDL